MAYLVFLGIAVAGVIVFPWLLVVLVPLLVLCVVGGVRDGLRRARLSRCPCCGRRRVTP